MSNLSRKLENDELLEALQARYATKVFDPTRKIGAADWEALSQALVLTPSSYGLQPWRFVHARDPGVRERLLPFSWNQRQVVDASHFVVLAGRTSLGVAQVDALVARIAEVRGVTRESLASYREMMLRGLVTGGRKDIIPEWAARQTYIALGNLLTCAALLGIDACPMEGLDPARYDEVLKLSGSGFRTLAACALGYRAAADEYAGARKVRFPAAEVLTVV